MLPLGEMIVIVEKEILSGSVESYLFWLDLGCIVPLIREVNVSYNGAWLQYSTKNPISRTGTKEARQPPYDLPIHLLRVS